MENCKTCRWWYEGECGKIDISYRSSQNDSDDKAEVIYSVDDDSGLTIAMHTGPEFGCAHHERKVPCSTN